MLSGALSLCLGLFHSHPLSLIFSFSLPLSLGNFHSLSLSPSLGLFHSLSLSPSFFCSIACFDAKDLPWEEIT